MSRSIDISVLVAARDEYIEQLKCIVCPLILQGINSIYQDALDESEGKKTLYKFQEHLREVPKWNQTILQEESKRIKRKCPYIMDIVTAIFVSNVKILASIRLKGKNENIRVKIPTSDIFIHSIYIESAHQIFYNPYLFYHKNNSLQKNKKEVFEIIRTSIDETIRQMLPFDNILQEYLANALNDNASNASSDTESEDEESISDSDEDSLHGNDLVGSESDSEPEDEEQNIKQIITDPVLFQNQFQNQNKPIGPIQPVQQIQHEYQNHPDQIQNQFQPVQNTQNQFENVTSFDQLKSVQNNRQEVDSDSDSEPEPEPSREQQRSNENVHSFF